MKKKKLSRTIKAIYSDDFNYIHVYSTDFPDIYEDVYGFYKSILDINCRIAIVSAKDKVIEKIRKRIKEEPFKLIINDGDFNYEF